MIPYTIPTVQNPYPSMKTHLTCPYHGLSPIVYSRDIPRSMRLRLFFSNYCILRLLYNTYVLCVSVLFREEHVWHWVGLGSGIGLDLD
ncbi:hypothetical protein BJX64DRAFT_135446 [Aspergillus heterothallicus]